MLEDFQETNTDIMKAPTGSSTNSSIDKSTSSNILADALSVNISNLNEDQSTPIIDNFTMNKKVIDGLMNEDVCTRKDSFATDICHLNWENGYQNEMEGENTLTVSYSTKDSQKWWNRYC